MSIKIIFATGMGRSGSTFLANLVNQSENASGVHEYFADKFFQGLSYYSPNHPHLAAHLREREAALREQGVELVVDADPFLRYGVHTVKELWPDAPLFHLARNGRKVIASMYQRTSYSSREKRQPILPLTPEEYHDWPSFSRFEKLCWYWADAIRTMTDAGLPLLRLEDITTDFQLLDERFLSPCGIKLSKKKWESMRSHRANTNRFKLKYLVRGKPEVLQWDARKEQRFQDLCGTAMEQLNYS